jgi:hypothetical protein
MKAIVFRLFNLIPIKNRILITINFYKLHSVVKIKNSFSNQNYHQIELGFFCMVFDLYKNSNTSIKEKLKKNLINFFNSDFKFSIEDDPLIKRFTNYSPVDHENYWSDYYLTFGEKEKIAIKNNFKGKQVLTGDKLFDFFASDPNSGPNMNFNNPVYFLSDKINSEDYPLITSFHFHCYFSNCKLKTITHLGDNSNILYPFSMSLVLNKIYASFPENKVKEFKERGRTFVDELEHICEGKIENIITKLNLKI